MIGCQCQTTHLLFLTQPKPGARTTPKARGLVYTDVLGCGSVGLCVRHAWDRPKPYSYHPLGPGPKASNRPKACGLKPTSPRLSWFNMFNTRSFKESVFLARKVMLVLVLSCVFVLWRWCLLTVIVVIAVVICLNCELPETTITITAFSCGLWQVIILPLVVPYFTPNRARELDRWSSVPWAVEQSWFWRMLPPGLCVVGRTHPTNSRPNKDQMI